VVTERHLESHARFGEAGLPAHHVHGTRNRITPEEGTLRAAKHLDPFDVEQIELRAEQERIVDVVDVIGDGRLAAELRIRLTDSAQVDRYGGTEYALRLTEHGVRNDVP